ncbi:2,4'-dihydroxyacetophenone dioxygenase family protein [Phenylobacterium sp.]|uniref:2,4'-dihydroxyacetophenone dioxygenase family protein n=1 Tax=Phenylobacterium sp. TaxID=1871053 RepID=UPI0035AF9FDA
MALPQTTTHQDRLLTVNIADTPASPGEVNLTPLFLDRENGVWVLYGKFAPGTVLPKHFHTGVVHFFTTKGRWNYAEYPDDPQTAGSYLFEPAGSIHTFTVPADAPEPAEGFMVVYGANVNFEGEEFQDITDAGSLEDMFQAAAQAGLMAPPVYIRPGPGGAGLSTAQAAPRAEAAE